MCMHEQSKLIPASACTAGSRGVPAWMADGDAADGGNFTDGRRDVASDEGESQQARMRREVEAERLQYKQQASGRGAPASSPMQVSWPTMLHCQAQCILLRP